MMYAGEWSDCVGSSWRRPSCCTMARPRSKASLVSIVMMYASEWSDCVGSSWRRPSCCTMARPRSKASLVEYSNDVCQ